MPNISINIRFLVCSFNFGQKLTIMNVPITTMRPISTYFGIKKNYLVFKHSVLDMKLCNPCFLLVNPIIKNPINSRIADSEETK